MPIEVVCQCGSRFAARDDLAGKTVACPACKAPLRIPPPRPAAIPVAQTGVGSILDEIGVQAVDERGIVCPKCRNYIPIGTSVCKKCRYNLQTASFQESPPVGTTTPHGGGYDWKALRNSQPALGSVVDEELTFADMALCAFFGCLMFPYGLVLFLRGHAKGILIMLGSMIIPAFITLLYIMFKFMTTVPPKKAGQLHSPAPAVMCEVEPVTRIEFRAAV